MKLESLVIADQNAAVNTFDLTAREEQSKAGSITGVKS